MVTFLPFSGYRPSLRTGEQIGGRISPPYDVIGPDYLRDLQSHQDNVTNLTLRQDADGRYSGSRKELERMISSGSLKQDGDSFYLYEQTFSDRGVEKRRRGLVGILKTESYEKGNVIPHEETFSKVKEDRLNLLRDMESHLESIFGIFEGLTDQLNKKIDSTAQLLYRYVDRQGVEHKFYRIGDAGVQEQITSQLSGQKMLIADGHHRYETALNYSLENPNSKKKGFVLATLVAANDPGLVIWPTHRLVKSDEISEKNAAAALSKTFDLEETSAEGLKETLHDHLFALEFRSGKRFFADYGKGEGPIWKLDTYVAQELILKGVYKYDEGKAEVAYDAELPSVEKKMSEKQYDLAVIFNPPSLQTIWDLSMAGKRMPKKTTFFFPKIWSGFVIYKMV
ncbi:MAG: DUF1015 domain-containing protein [Candidatus Methanoplasma sp.]|jgi:uncharacterized protein (DUF1015 family)|nr:DUF1015 domain-containing protein [Candidatus Methanoplasma sp.]